MMSWEISMRSSDFSTQISCRGSRPTTSSFVCRPYLYGSNEACNLTVPVGESELYIMIQGWRAAPSSPYDLSVTYITP